MFRIGLQLYTW